MRRFLIILMVTFALYGCGESPVCGGSSDHGNARVAGVITDQLGVPLRNATVILCPENYNHVTDSLRTEPLTTTTDTNGFYSFDSVISGKMYTVSGNNEYGDAGFFRKQVAVDTVITEDTIISDRFGQIYIETDSLHLAKGMILYFPGLKKYHIIDDKMYFYISQVPCGFLPIKAFDPLTGKSFNLNQDSLFLEIIPGRILTLSSRSPKPFCVKGDSVTSCNIGFTKDTFNISISAPSIHSEGAWEYRISWGDGSISELTSESRIAHQYTDSGYFPVQSQVLFRGHYLAWSDALYIEIIDR